MDQVQVGPCKVLEGKRAHMMREIAIELEITRNKRFLPT